MRSNSGFRPIYLWPPLYRTVRVQITRAEQIAYLTAVLVQAGGLTKLFGIWFAPFERVHQIAPELLHMKNRILILIKNLPVLPENCIVEGTQLLLACSLNFRSGLFHTILFSV